MRLRTSPAFVLMVACACCLPPLLAQDAKPREAAPDDLKLLQGGWEMVAQESEGMRLPASGRWVFKGSEVQAGYTGADLRAMGTVKLDSSKRPKHLDLVGTEGRAKGEIIPGIFKFDKDGLIIGLGPRGTTERPEDFVDPPGSNWTVLTFKRIKE